MKFEYQFEDITLKVLDETYAPLVLAFCKQNRTVFDQYEVEKPENFYTLEFQKRLISAEYEGFLHGKYVRFYMFDNHNTQKIIGTVSFSEIKRNSFFSCQTGYKVDSDYVNQSYGAKMLSEAIKIMTSEYSMHRITAYIMPDNLPSIKLVEKLGFELEGIARSYVLLNGTWMDHLNYVFIAGPSILH